MKSDPPRRPSTDSIDRPSGDAVPAVAAVAAPALEAAVAAPTLEAAVAAPTLEAVLGELRRLAILALDAGHPLAAAQIATTADRVEAEARRDLPPRPRYGA